MGENMPESHDTIPHVYKHYKHTNWLDGKFCFSGFLHDFLFPHIVFKNYERMHLLDRNM